MTLKNYHLYTHKDNKLRYILCTDKQLEDTPLEEYHLQTSKYAHNWYEAHYYLVNIFLKNEYFSETVPKEESDVDIFLDAFNWAVYTNYHLEYTEEALDSVEILPPLDEYRYLVCNANHDITYISVVSKDKIIIQFKEQDGTFSNIIVKEDDGFIYGNGKTQKEALISAGYYLKGYLH